jgi:TP901 family phage tail tape measure protein
MSDNIDIPVQASGEDGVNRLVSALDRLHDGLAKLGNQSGLTSLAEQMKVMQATMVTGFTEMSALAKKSGGEIVSAHTKTAEEVAVVNEKARDRQLNADRVFAQTHKDMLDKQLQADVTFAQAQLKHAEQQAGAYISWWAKAAGERVAIEQRRDVEMHALRAKEHNDYVSWWEKSLAKQIEIEQRRDVEMHALRAKQHNDYAAWWQQELATADAAHALQLEKERKQQYELAGIRATAAERQRALNTGFLTSPIQSQIATAEKAQVYSHLGGNAAEKYGSAAAGADIAALRTQHKLLEEAVRSSRNAVGGHNDAMREAHSLARGLAGSLGGLWMTYGSIVPLVAGAALAASLKGVVTAGKEVEYQLKFVEALGGGQVNLDRLLHITDATVVSVKETAEGMRALAQNGIAAAEGLKVLPSILNLAVIGEMSVSQAALAATGTVSAFGLQLSDLDRVSNIFAQAAATSNTSVLAMTESMKQASTVASVYGSTIEETSAALGVLAKVNITGGAAGTAYTNMLTNLYTPTEKAKKALAELGVSSAHSNGELKNTTELMGELRSALAGYNDSAQASFLGDVFTVRGQKGAATLLNNWDLYIKKIEEARNVTNFMGEGVSKLEDTTEGALKRLSNNVSSSFNKAFADSSAPLQRLVMHLGEIARSPAVVSTLTSISDAILRVTTVAVEHASTLGIMLGAYTALRVVSALPAVLAAVSAGLNAATLSMRTLTAAMGWITVGVTALVVLYQLFIEKTSDVEKADIRRQNSIQTNIEYLDREIERLRERNKLWNPDTLQFDKKPESTTETTLESERRVLAERERSLEALRARPVIGGGDNQDRASSAMARANQERTLVDQIAKSKQRLWELTLKQEDLDSAVAVDQTRRTQESTVLSINGFLRQGEAYDKLSANYAGKDNEAFLRKTQQAQSIKDQLIGNKITTDEAISRLSKLKSEASGLLSGREEKPKGANDRLNASLKEIELKLQLQKLDSEAEISAARQQNKRGELGDLALINKELEAKLATDRAAVEVARQQWVLADANNKAAKAQEYENRGKVAKKQETIDISDAAEKRQSVLARMAREELSFDAKTLVQKGQHQAAYLKEYEATYGVTIARVNADILTATSETEKSALQSYLAYLAKLKEAGKQNAWIKELQNNFNQALNEIQNQMDRLDDASGPGAGLAAVFNNALIATQAYGDALPGLIEKQQALQAAALVTHDPADQQKADSALKQIEDTTKRMRNMWVGVGESIGKSLEKAFGIGGKALGGLLNATVAYGVKRIQIEQNFEKAKKSAGDDPVKQLKAQKDMQLSVASAQIASYGDMTAAAQGFFKEGSRGYVALGAAEKVFRMAELAMTAQAMYQKLFATNAVTAAVVTGHVAEAGAAVAAAPVIAGANMAIGQTAAVAGVATQAMGDPYSAWVRMAAMAAVMVGLGFAVSGGGKKDTTAQDRQAAAGTGSVFGDLGVRQSDGSTKYSTKSESIKRAIELSAANSNIELAYTQGMLRALLNIQNALGGLGNLLIRGSGVTGELPAQKLGAAAQLGEKFSTGVFAGPLGMTLDKITGGWVSKMTGKIGNAIFGGNTTAIDGGLTANKTTVAGALAGGLHASSYVEKKKDGGWFHSDRQWTEPTALGTEADQQFSQIIGNMAKGITEAGALLGLGGTAFTQRLNAFVVDIGKISTKGMTGEEIQKQLETTFSKLGDDMARWTVGGLAPFQKVGEGYLETLVRVAANYANLDSVLKSIGMTFGATGMASLAARERLIDMAGGIDELAAKASSFADNFLTEAERLAPVQAYVTEQMAKLGYASVDTRDEFKRLVLGLNLTSVSGQENYVALMALQEAFAKVYAATEDLTKSQQEIADEHKSLRDELEDLMMSEVELRAKERNALDASNRALYDQVQAAKLVVDAREQLSDAYDKEKSSIEGAIDRVKSLGESWTKFRDGLLLGDKSTLTPWDKYQEAKTQFASTLNAARGGDEGAQSNYEAAANAFLEASRTANASSEAYTQDFNLVRGSTAEAIAWAAQQVSIEQQSLDALNRQVIGLVDIKQSVLSVAEAIAKLAQATLNVGVWRPVPEVKPTPDYAKPGAADVLYAGAQSNRPAQQAQSASSAAAPGPTAAQMAALLAEMAALRKQQAQEAQDQVNTNVDATRDAAETMAETVRSTAENTARMYKLHAESAYE